MRDVFRGLSALLPIWIDLVGLFLVLYGGSKQMMDITIFGILVTVVCTLFTGLAELIKTFRDGSVLKDTNKDTTDMKPKVDDIKAAVSTTNTILLDAVKPTMKSVNEQAKKIDTVVTSMARFEGLVQGSRANEMRPDELMAQMKAVYDERYELLMENQALREENDRLREENRELEQQLQDIEPEPPARKNSRVR